MKNSTEPRPYRRWLFLFLFCFCAGVLFGNFCKGEESLYYRFRSFSSTDIKSRELFLYCGKERIPGLLFLLVTGPGNLGIPMVYLSIAWYGFSFGAMLTIAVLRMGLPGLLIGICAMLPQYLVYIPLMLCLYRMILSYHSYGRKRLLKFILFGTCIFVLYVAGLLLEGYINPILLHKLFE